MLLGREPRCRLGSSSKSFDEAFLRWEYFEEFDDSKGLQLQSHRLWKVGDHSKRWAFRLLRGSCSAGAMACGAASRVSNRPRILQNLCLILSRISVYLFRSSGRLLTHLIRVRNFSDSPWIAHTQALLYRLFISVERALCKGSNTSSCACRTLI